MGAEDYEFPGVVTTQWQRGQAQQVDHGYDHPYGGNDHHHPHKKGWLGNHSQPRRRIQLQTLQGRPGAD